jgi:methionyl-tRNA formyltransferase
MNLAFAGTPEFAAVALRSLITHGHRIELVLTQPDRPAGRGMRLAASPVSQVADGQGIPVFKPTTLKDPTVVARIAEAGCAALVVAAYGLILPQSVLSLPPHGCLNIHASLLPRWRGAAPIHRAIEAGDRESGITIMQMDAGLDTGAIVCQQKLAIGVAETTGSLTERLARLGAETINEALVGLDDFRPQPQDDRLATYAGKVRRSEARIDWHFPAVVLERRIRAFDPFPGCETTLGGKTLKLWAANVVEGTGNPGSVLSVTKSSLTIATGDGALSFSVVQRPGGRRLTIADFLSAEQLSPGMGLGT